MSEQDLKRLLTHKLREGLSKDYDALYVKEYSTMWETERFLRKSELNIMNLDNALDSILSLLSQRIKAKALTDEELIEAINSPYGKNMYEQVTKGDRAIAAAQLQAVLGELE